jgi:hypothetical protein
MKLRICWWNTGLSPPIGVANDPGHLLEVIEKLKILQNSDVDLFCLGEVNEEAIADISNSPNFADYVFLDRAKDGATRYNMSFGFKKNSMRLENFVFIAERISTQKRKIAQSFDLVLKDNSSFRLFAVHWPSRLYAPETANTRSYIGVILRSLINDEIEQSPDAKIILLGDFNDEPFNEAIHGTLSASRDPEFVKINNYLLYNPFWKKMSPSTNGTADRVMCGSYYYQSGTTHKWFVFDQALVSSSLLRGSDWNLIEDETDIWPDGNQFGVGPQMSKTIDHLPIIVTIGKLK